MLEPSGQPHAARIDGLSYAREKPIFVNINAACTGMALCVVGELLGCFVMESAAAAAAQMRISTGRDCIGSQDGINADLIMTGNV